MGYVKVGIIAILGIFVIFMLIWGGIQGPVTVMRIVLHGDTTIEDHKLYPFRSLKASSNPFRFHDSQPEDLQAIDVDGLGSVSLNSLLSETQTIAMVILEGDTLKWESYHHGHAANQISQAFSTSKSILSILIGAAIDDGIIESVNQPITAYVPELSNAGFSEVRIADLLTMKSNIDYAESDNPFSRHVRFNYTPDLEDEILSLTLKVTPDQTFIYKSGDNALLALVLKRALQDKTITEYTQERLWTPLGMEFDGKWTLDSNDGLEKTWCCLSAAARDFAKLGALYRDGGMSQGKQVISKKWIEASTRQGHYSSEQWDGARFGNGFQNYGYQWWLIDTKSGTFTSRGKNGQFIFVDTDRNIVIVRLGYSFGEYQRRSLSTADWLNIFKSVSNALTREY